MTDHTDLIRRLRGFAVHWGDLPSIAPHVEKAPGVTTGCVLGATTQAADALEAQAARIAELEGRANITPMQFHEAVVAAQKLGREQGIRDAAGWHTSEYHRIVEKYGVTDPALTHLESATAIRALPLPPAPQEGE